MFLKHVWKQILHMLSKHSFGCVVLQIVFESDQTWVATETRSAAAVFHSEGQGPANADSFTVDGITVQFTVE